MKEINANKTIKEAENDVRYASNTLQKLEKMAADAYETLEQKQAEMKAIDDLGYNKVIKVLQNVKETNAASKNVSKPNAIESTLKAKFIMILVERAISLYSYLSETEEELDMSFREDKKVDFVFVADLIAKELEKFIAEHKFELKPSVREELLVDNKTTTVHSLGIALDLVKEANSSSKTSDISNKKQDESFWARYRVLIISITVVIFLLVLGFVLYKSKIIS